MDYEFQSIIQEYITLICELLDIEEPALTFGGDFATPTTMAAYNPKMDLLFLNPEYCINNEQGILLMLYCVAHEIRHKWQYKSNNDAFSGYRRSNELSLKEYNSQWIEIDANAFALAFMDCDFDDWDKIGLHNDLFQNKSVKERYSILLKELNELLTEGGYYES